MEKVAYQCINVVGSSSSINNFSRHVLLQWINDTLNKKLQKVESLCSGTVYCELMNLLFPGCIPIKKVKYGATQEHEYIYNLKLLQIALKTVKCDKDVPIDRLIKGRFQENFEFLQWFKKFFDANADMQHSVSSNCPTSSSVVQKQLHSSLGKPLQFHNPVSQTQMAERNIKTQIAQLKDTINLVEQEKDFYFRKLRNIEIICNEASPGEDKKILAEKIMDEICATEEDFVTPQPTDTTY